MLLTRARVLAWIAPPAVVGAVYLGCGGAESHPGAVAGAAGATTGGASGAGGAATSGASGKAAGGGGAGVGGSAGAQAFQWGPAETIGECAIRVLQNPGLTAFNWAPCPWTNDPACEEAIWREPVAEAQGNAWKGVTYQTNIDAKSPDGTLAVITDYPPRALLVSREGIVQAGVDYQGPNTCAVSTGRPIGQRLLFTAGAANDTPFPYHPCFLQGQSLACSSFKFACDAPAWNEATDTHWGWECSSAVYAMSVKDGSMQQVLSKQNPTMGPVYDLSTLTASRKHFFWKEYVEFEGHVARQVSYSDGVGPSKVLLPPGPGTQDDGEVHFTGTHLVWTRGYDFVDLGVYKKVELWMSPWDDDAPGVTPTKVMDWPAPSLGNGFSPVLENGWKDAAFGRIVFPTWGQKNSLTVLDLTTKATQAIEIPSSQELRKVMGLTSTHLWFLTYDYPGPPYLRHMVRWKVAP